MNESQLRSRMRTEGIDLNAAATLEGKSLEFERALRIVLPPKDVSDRTAFRNITQWLVNDCKKGRFDEHSIFRTVLDFAIEASGPNSRNPAAVFMSILKKELGYYPK